MGCATATVLDVREPQARYGGSGGYEGDPRAAGAAPVRRGPEPCGSEDRGEAADLDALEALGDEIATLAAHLHAATQRLLTLIARFDRLGGWERDGFRSCAHWLAFRTGIGLGAAREKVRAPRPRGAAPAERIDGPRRAVVREDPGAHPCGHARE